MFTDQKTRQRLRPQSETWLHGAGLVFWLVAVGTVP